MKPFYFSKKIWAAIVTGGAAMAAERLGRPELAPLIVALGMALLVALGLADFGKEAGALEFPPDDEDPKP